MEQRARDDTERQQRGFPLLVKICLMWQFLQIKGDVWTINSEPEPLNLRFTLVCFGVFLHIEQH